MGQESQTITASSGSNLAISFSFLDKEKRDAMSAFYAFCRVVDDIADDTELPRDEKIRQLSEWRDQIALCYGGSPTIPLARELAPVLQRYAVPKELPLEIIAGVEMDAHQTEYETWEDLRLYCHRVASCVGLVSIEIFGYTQPGCREYAELLGLAFQTTNILRDVRTDLGYGRIYLPQEDFAKAGCTRDDLRHGKFGPEMRHLFRLMGERSEHYYAAAERALPEADRGSMLAAQIMRGVYHAVLDKIRGRDFDVWHHNARHSKPTKLWLMQKTFRAEKNTLRQRKPKLPPGRVVVAGGGLAGLAAAVSIALQGHRVTLVEARQTLGGRAHSYRDPKTGDTLDNGQHILMGCYKRTLDFLGRLGTRTLLNPAPRLSVPYASEALGITRFSAPPLPQPLGLLAAMALFPEMSGADRTSGCRGGLAAKFATPSKWRGRTVSDWIRHTGQTPGAVRALWEPFCAAALNETVGDASAALFLETVRRAFLAGPEDAAIITSTVGLSDLFAKPAADILAACGGQILVGESVARLDFSGASCERAVLSSGAVLTGDAFVSAMPWHALKKLLPDSPLKKQIEPLTGAPIIGIHLWFDRPVCPEPFVGFLDSPIHWAFDRTALHGASASGWPSLALVVSAAAPLMETPTPELIDLALKECRRFLPAARDAQLMHHFVYRARDATVRAIPSMHAHRPATRTDWDNFVLAGDWTATGLPSTIEGAVQSGVDAAAVFGSIG